MSDIENKKLKFSKLAILSFLAGLIGLNFYVPLSLFYFYEYPKFIDVAVSWIILLSILSGTVLSVIAIMHIKKNKGIVRGRIFSILALIIIAGILLMTFHSVLVNGWPALIRCKWKLINFRKVFQLYAQNHQGKYPSPDQWCDETAKYFKFPSKKLFLCPKAIELRKKGPSHYAMNPNCEPNSPNDVVLLFETKGGWNQHGGPELLSFDNHNGKNLYVIFNDGFPKYIEPNDVGKLKWKAEVNETKQ